MHSVLPLAMNCVNFLLLTAVSGEQIIEGVTLERIYEHVVWCFFQLMRGSWPTEDSDGNCLRHRGEGPLTSQGYTGRCAHIEGDWKWTKEVPKPISAVEVLAGTR